MTLGPGLPHAAGGEGQRKKGISPSSMPSHGRRVAALPRSCRWVPLTCTSHNQGQHYCASWVMCGQLSRVPELARSALLLSQSQGQLSHADQQGLGPVLHSPQTVTCPWAWDARDVCLAFGCCKVMSPQVAKTPPWSTMASPATHIRLFLTTLESPAVLPTSFGSLSLPFLHCLLVPLGGTGAVKCLGLSQECYVPPVHRGTGRGSPQCPNDGHSWLAPCLGPMALDQWSPQLAPHSHPGGGCLSLAHSFRKSSSCLWIIPHLGSLFGPS